MGRAALLLAFAIAPALAQAGPDDPAERVTVRTGPTPIPGGTAQGAGNPFVFYAYVFVPKQLDRSRKQPLLVFPHGGVHPSHTPPPIS